MMLSEVEDGNYYLCRGSDTKFCMKFTKQGKHYLNVFEDHVLRVMYDKHIITGDVLVQASIVASANTDDAIYLESAPEPTTA